MNYFWYYDPETTPRTVTRPAEIVRSDRLAMACTQTGLPGKQQAALVRQWCEVLPSLTHVRLLWLTSKVPQALFDAVCRMRGLRGLYIKWSGLTSLDQLVGLRHLRYFHLGSSTQVRSIKVLEKMKQLRWLGLENLKQVRDVSAVRALTGLEGLSLGGSIWSTWRLRTLKPLAGLRRLRYLSLLNLRTDDKSLAPLAGLRRLETFFAERWWDRDELDALHRNNRRLPAFAADDE
jgi:hypothetical protein